ncbi:MAG TPA: alpha/beta fold hydrolase [Candidatus Dormibacteraeota bacterium]
MPQFDSDGVRLHYTLAGPDGGPPIVLVHGYCSDYDLNWVGTRWQETLAGAGRRILGLDCRGHGRSEKPHDPAAYARRTMADDVVRLLDHLDIGVADYLGYSMGARIGLEAVIAHPDRLRRAVLGGLGRWDGGGRSDLIARRMRGDESVTDAAADMFYRFASARPVNDLEALACCILGPQPRLTPADLAGISVPVAIMVGEQDPIASGAPGLAAEIPGARYVAIAGRNHMNAVPARQFKEAAISFLDHA